MIASITVLVFRFAAIQGFILAFSLLAKKAKTPANQTLGVWIIFLSLDLIFQSFAVDVKFLLDFPLFTGAVSGMPLIHGPMLFFYTGFVAQRFKPKLSMLFHFLPFLAAKIYLVPWYLMKDAEKVNFLELIVSHPPLTSKAINFITGAHGLTYTIISFIIMKKHGRNILEYFSYKEKVVLQWLKILIALNIFPWSIVLIASGITLFFGKPMHQVNLIIYFLVSILIYITGYFGFSHSVIFPGEPLKTKDLMVWRGAARPSRHQISIFRGSPEPGKYEKTKLSQNKKSEIKEKLLNIMTNKAWLEPELTIKDISNKINVPIYQISQTINDEFEMNFFTFINRYRLEEVKNRLRLRKYRDYSILQIALECGFNSKSSFNSLFREYTGKTPTQYREFYGRAAARP